MIPEWLQLVMLAAVIVTDADHGKPLWFDTEEKRDQKIKELRKKNRDG